MAAESNRKVPLWLIGLGLILVIIIVPIFIFLPRAEASDDAWANVPVRPPHTDHTHLLQGPFTTGSEVTRACLECHPEAAQQVMGTVHWTWESQAYTNIPGHEGEPVTIGKKNQINNFCIGIQGNWNTCTSCHAGYGWLDAGFDFTAEENVDCLVCHDLTTTYAKTTGGYPAEGVDLLAVAQSVGTPTRENCGGCHFDGGGGNGVKHGDLDESLIFPPESVDVHMGGNDFQCVDCHQTEDHRVSGRSISDSFDMANQIYCTDCHSETLHADERINAHVATIACQACHIPNGALRDPTKMFWDWSTAGQDLPEDHYTFLRIKGSFIYEYNFTPEYFWYSGIADRYIFGDVIDPSQVTEINTLAGDISDPNARIMPFKIHVAIMPYDSVNNYLLQPRTGGEGGLWTTFDWPSALVLGAQDTGLEFSGQYDFTETWMYWPTTHMVQPAENALTCEACHSSEGRLDWLALGYPGDPMEWGGREITTP
ncbi:MAG TPA: tetrathionate reductase family octaheme c-type cytochrome [Anaerolineales bacterium]|nr:tetrathionate reductase family octaheme c-type cytochrome [Anaerolineales bacterium]